MKKALYLALFLFYLKKSIQECIDCIKDKKRKVVFKGFSKLA